MMTQMLMGAGPSVLLDATMTEGTVFNFYNFYGYDSLDISGAGNFGSMSSTSILSGGTLSSLFDVDGPIESVLKITIGSDPGASYFTSVTVGAVQKLSSAATYSYGGGIATWVWSGLFGLDGTGTSSVVIS